MFSNPLLTFGIVSVVCATVVAIVGRGRLAHLVAKWNGLEIKVQTHPRDDDKPPNN